jgi:hypothetical protein
MKITILKFFVGAALGIASAAWVAYPQAGPGPRGTRNYNPATEVTVTGVVDAVRNVEGRGRSGGTHLTLKTDSETLGVHAGPTSFLKEHDFSFAKGDQIEVTGSKIKYQGADAIIAREIKKDGKTLTLRNAQGVPEWSRGRGSRRTP